MAWAAGTQVAEVEEENKDMNSRLVFEVSPKGDLSIICQWPKTLDSAGVASLVNNMSGLLYYIFSGKLRKGVFASVDKQGRDNNQPHISSAIREVGEKKLSAEGFIPDEDAPVVSPIDVFKGQE